MRIDSFKVYKWHSINVVPHYASVAVVTDEPPYSVTGRWYTLTVLGWVVSLVIEHEGAGGLAQVGKVYGPLWSRRRKSWYRFNNL